MATHPKIEIDPQAETTALVKQAQAAYAAGQDRDWAGALWLAGERAVRELAKSRGIACLRPPQAIRHSEFRNHRSVRYRNRSPLPGADPAQPRADPNAGPGD